MAEDFGRSVSYVSDPNGYAYDTVVWQKEKPILDTEQNLVQQIQALINHRQSVSIPSGWLSMYPLSVDRSLHNQFYTQDPSSAKPEYALVNGMVLQVTNTFDERDNVNVVDMGTAPTTGNRISGVFLEVWRALLDPNTSVNRPDADTILDSIYGVFMYNEDVGWLCGQNGLILYSSPSSPNWVLQTINTKKSLNGLYFITSGIGWVVGDNGTIGRTVSAGSTWNMLTSPTTENLNSIHAYSQLVAWAVGDSGTVLKTTNGITWVTKSSGVTANLNKAHFYNDQVGWVVGSGGTILKTTDGGTTWLAQTSGVGANLNSVHFWGLSYGFVVGDGGTILKTTDGGATWGDVSGNILDPSYTRWTTDFNDVCLIPTMDERVTDEEMTSQFDGVNKVCIVAHIPISKGDGKGTITNLPSDVTVTVNGTEVLVDAVNGSTGVITLNVAPVLHATVLVSYWYKNDCPVFMGKAWIVGAGGKALRTTNIGAEWIPLNTGVTQNLYATDFVDGDKGWAVGSSAVIRGTEDAGNTWAGETSGAVARLVQRVFKEGNVDTDIFLNDDSIHPDASVETTKRVQIQYRIRIVNGVDPDASPEAGLSSSIKGVGPNLSGQFPYENMGASTGDYGLWRAKCLNTVDGYCWAVPMFITARRNSSAYDPATNPNGEHKPGTFIRPDLLTAAMVVDGDLLDVRRKIIIPSLTELFESDLDLLSRNRMLTVMARQSGTGDQYGSQLLQIDRVGAGTGGDPIVVGLNTVASGSISAALTFNTQTVEVNAVASPNPNPIEQAMPSISGLYSQNPWDYSATYKEGIYAGQQVEGYWEGVGTTLPKFVFSVFIKNKDDDSGLLKYKLTARYNSPSASSLNRLPYNPQLTQNISGGGNPTVWYHGMLDSVASKVIESWDSTIPRHQNYAVVYPAKDSSDTSQRNRASSVELHLFYTVGTTGLTLQVPQQEITVVSGDSKWKIYSVSKVNNITSGFSHKIQNIQFLSPGITVTAVAGYTFVQGAVVEVVAYAVALEGTTRWQGIRNGASVNFTERTKAVNNFVESRWVEASILAPFSYVDISLGSAVLYGATTVETVSGLAQHSFWYGASLSVANLQAGVLSGWGTSTARVTFATSLIGKIWVQLLVKQTQLPHNDPNVDSLLIAYNFIPKQTVPSLPSSLTLDVVTVAPVIVSTLGIAGGAAGSPYDNPIEHIPLNGTITTGVPGDEYLGNYDPLQFGNYSINSGYVRLPTLIPAGVGQQVTLSSASSDAAGRTFYQTCSVATQFSAEGLVTTIPRKVYAPILARVKACSDGRFEVGEYVLVVFGKSTASSRENTVGSSDAIGVYRLPNKPICKV